ncbi:hypothetical protein [Catellatospora chokoriensis]|uniref:Lipoprotein n=1 Tax=Catellatospora chokoriensis TaxID=310353 RepID=A0A8J3K9U0_9ACTN|nr:hypothetical protein [Catellatospora chokoriensis]GIF92104.1 hypothetical protein Cch02nite_55480 [Catellatospora chokoriensis]
MLRTSVRIGAAVAVLLLGSCATRPEHAGQSEASVGHAGPTASAALDTCGPYAPFDAAKFAKATVVDNEWFPLVPGTQMIYDGRSVQDGTPVAHHEEFTVTGLTKVVNGVRTVVVIDRDLHDGKLDEQELSFFAQDDDGNVWNMGEYPEDYEDGRFTGAPDAWINAAAGAQAGVQMTAHPQPATPAYRQGYVPAIKFLDCAQPLQVGQKVCDATTCYPDTLLVDEWSPLDPGSGHQHKFYAARVGTVKVSAVDDPEAETLRLTVKKTLDPAQLHEVDTVARLMDTRAYRNAPAAYAATEPAS